MALIRKLMLMALVLMVAVFAAAFGALEIAMRRAARMSGPPLASRTEIVFRVDGSFTAAERALILDAFREIRQASGCVDLKASFEDAGLMEILTWRGDGHATIYRASNLVTWKYHTARHLAGLGWYMGIAMVRTGDIFIMASVGGEGTVDFRNTIIHEVLHVVFRSGWHSPDSNSLMYESIGGGEQKLLSTEIAMLRAMCAPPGLRKVSFYGNWIPRRYSDAVPAAVPRTARRLVQQTVESGP